MKQERNYTIEFFRFMFAVNFVLLHVFILGPVRMGGTPSFANGFDVIIPFMAFSGYFLMGHFKKQQAKGLTAQVPPSRQAWNYLKRAPSLAAAAVYYCDGCVHRGKLHVVRHSGHGRRDVPD